jgi:hypothetical protein
MDKVSFFYNFFLFRCTVFTILLTVRNYLQYIVSKSSFKVMVPQQFPCHLDFCWNRGNGTFNKLIFFKKQKYQ